VFPSVLPGGYAGVDVFFVISGYLITSHLWHACQQDGRVGLAAFWGRRARRLIPAAAVVLTATWGLSYLLLPSTRLADTAAQVRASALYFQNWQLARSAVAYLASDSTPTPVQHFWSLSVEEQFYLVWPLLFILAALATRRRTTRRSAAKDSAAKDSAAQDTATQGTATQGTASRAQYIAILSLTVALAAASLGYSVYDTMADSAAAYFVTTTRMWELAAGGILALLPAAASSRLARHGWLGWAGLAMIGASQVVLTATTPFPGWIALLPVAGTVALIAGGSAQASHGPSRLTSTRPMTFLGGISYSLYLWHWPVIVLWTAWRGQPPGVPSGLALIAASVLLSWLTKVTVEDRVRLAPVIARSRWRSLSTALAAVVPVALAAAFLATQPGPWNGTLPGGYPGAAALAGNPSRVPSRPVLPPVQQAAVIDVPTYWRSDRCLDGRPVAVPKTCVFGDTAHPRLTVALVGDSIAGNWWAPLDEIATREHWKLVTELHASCPWSATPLYDPEKRAAFTACDAWGAAVLTDLLTRIHPDVVITSGYVNMTSMAHPTAGPQARADVGAGEATYWRQLKSRGISVIAIRETPDMGLNVPTCVAGYGTDAGRCLVPRSKAVPADPPTSYAARALHGTVPVIDMTSLICGRQECPPVVGNVLVYLDNRHLTQSYAKTLAPYLSERLLSASSRVRDAE